MLHIFDASCMSRAVSRSFVVHYDACVSSVYNAYFYNLVMHKSTLNGHL
jgi:hypothetical protein